MILLMQTWKLVLRLLACFFALRRNQLKKLYESVAGEVATVESNLKANEVESGHPDYRNQARLGRLIEKQDVAQTKVRKAEKRVDWIWNLLTNVRQAKGRTVPYMLGAGDMLAIVYLIETGEVQKWYDLLMQLLVLLGVQ